MPANLDFALYLNIALFSMLGMGLLIGFMKGMKNAMWGFLVTLIFFAFFFLTLDLVTNTLWTMNLPFLGGLLANVSPALSGVTQLQQALPILMNEFLGDTLGPAVDNAHLLEFATSIALFALKVVYMILYFTVIQILYRLILWIIKLIVFPSKKKTDKYRSKNRGIGAIFGLLSGAMSLYVTLIIFGGVISIADSVVSIMPEDVPTQMNQIVYNQEFSSPTTPLFRTGSIIDEFISPDIESAMNLVNDAIDAYNTNIIITTQNQITMTSDYTGEEMPLNLYLFDQVLSMDYQDEQIAFRAEIEIFTDAGALVLANPYMESRNLSDVTGNDIRDVFGVLADSNLFTTLIPVGVEVGYEMFDITGFDVDLDAIYDIPWDEEIVQLGEIAAMTFDIINAAGIFIEGTDYTTVQIDGDEVTDLFDAISQSELVTLAAYIVLEPMLETTLASAAPYITVPADINWTDEFEAIGAFMGSVLSTDLTYGDIESQNISAMLTALAQVDFELLLDSQIITSAMVNILSGQTPIDVSFLNVPVGIEWYDTEVDGETVYGELHNILIAVNALTSTLSGIDITSFTDFNIQTLADLDLTSINAVFESQILVATITDYIANLDLGADYQIIIPDSAYENGYLRKQELQDVVSAVQMLLENLTCDVGDTACEELGFDFMKVLTLTSDNIDVLLEPDIFAATVGNILIDMTGDVLTIPGSSLTTIYVDEVPMSVVSPDEIKYAFLAVSVLGITSVDDIQVDASILSNLAVSEAEPTVLDTDKAATLFASDIIKATLTAFLMEATSGDTEVVIVPYLDPDGLSIREIDAVDGVTVMITEAELTNILKGILALDITDFSNFDTINLGDILSNVSVLLDSAILHATVSNQLLQMTDIIVVPYFDLAGDPIRITNGPVGHETTYIDKDELEAAIDALQVLGISDINNVSMDITILNDLGTEADPTILDTTKSTTLFASSIINATLSKYIFDMTDVEDPFIIVPYRAQDTTIIRVASDYDDTEYISEDELTHLLQAILVLDLQDFGDLSTFNLDTLFANIDTLLDSSILHASISKQLLDLTDVVTVPLNKQDTTPLRITTDLDGHLNEYIDREELIATIDALQVLGITDIDTVAIDVSILNNLGTEADPTVLDEDKADTLFASSIICATLSGYMIDIAEPADPADAFLVVPWKVPDGLGGEITVRTTDPADGTKYITSDELTNVFRAVLALDLQDFDSVESFTLETIIANKTVMLDSAILHATISKQLNDLGADLITIPLNKQNGDPLRITLTDGTNSNEYIDRNELEATLDALQVLGITDIAGVAIDITILNRLATEGDTTVLDTTKSDVLFASSIITATLSLYIIDIAEPEDPGADPFLVVPYTAPNGLGGQVTIRTIDPADSTQYITEEELTYLLKAILKLDLDNFDAVETFTLDTIIANSDVLLDSAIFHATISKQLTDLGSDLITIPQNKQNGDPCKVTTTDGTNSNDFIDRDELDATFNALQVLGITDIGSVAVDVGILNNLGTDLDPTVLDTTKSDALFASSIMTATISKFMIDFNDDAEPLIYVPQNTETGTVIRTLDPVDGTEYINETELTNVLKAILALDLGNFSEVEGLTMTTIIDNRVVLLDSAIMQATISKQIIDLSGDTIIIPEQEEDDSTYVLIAVEANTGQWIEYIARDQIDALLDVFVVLNMTEINDFTGSIDLTLLAAPGAIDTLVASAIIQATISKQVFDIVDDPLATTDLIVPYQTDNEATPVTLRIMAGDTVETELIKASEIQDLLEAFVAMELTNIDSIGDNISLQKLADNAVTVFESYIIQATVSGQILALGAVITPALGDDDLTAVITTTGIIGHMTDFISKTELKEFVEAATVFVSGDGGVDSFDGGMDLSLLNDPGNRTTLLESSIMQATISDQINNLGGDIRIPIRDVNNVLIQITTTEGDFYLSTDEIGHLLDALDILGETDNLADFGGTLSISNLFESQDSVNYAYNRSTLLASAIMHATITDQIQALDPGVGERTIIIPIDGLASEPVKLYTVISADYFIDKDEISHLLDALDLLGFNGADLSGFGGALDISGISTDTQKNTVLNSVIIHATISRQLLNLADDVLIVPLYSEDGELAIYAIQSTPDVETFIVKTEIKAILTAFNEMGFGNLTTGMPAEITSDVFFDNPGLYLQSSSIQATLSQKLFDINESSTILIFPDFDIRTDPDTDLIIDQSDVTYILKAELLLLMAAMDEMGLTDFTDVQITPLIMQNKNYQTITDSAIMQATISDNILNGATDESSAVSGKLIVPAYFHETIAVETVATDWIEQTELMHLLAAFSEFGLDSFNSIDASNFNTLTGTQIDIITTSGSMHTTIDYMLQNNGNISGSIPSKAIDSYDYVAYDMVTPDEIRCFILATNVIAQPGDSITNITFDVTIIQGLDSGERDIVLDSMIVRNMLTDELEAKMTLDDPLDLYWPDNSDYEDNNPASFLTELGINNVLTHYGI
ncbi:MAG: hypothetical protein JXB08_03020 [Bacilli bacterium]|nr:hypothetical protein [Bacilli bacterium]MBN2876057.1 hypothetical protein [Bacilli bacterium]